MAQLKDSVVQGSLRVTDTTYSTNINLASATASQAVLTDANKNLVAGVIPVSSGGTGATSFTANSVIISGSTTTEALTTRAIYNRTTKGDLEWSSTNTDIHLVTKNTIAFWDGSYQVSGTNHPSNLTYVNGASFTGSAAASYVASFFGSTSSTTTSSGALVVKGGIGTGAASFLQGSVHIVGAAADNPVITRGISGSSSTGVRGTTLADVDAGLYLNHNGGPIIMGHSTSATINSNTHCKVSINYTQDTSSGSTGAFTVAGGVGIKKCLYTEGRGWITSTTAADTTRSSSQLQVGNPSNGGAVGIELRRGNFVSSPNQTTYASWQILNDGHLHFKTDYTATGSAITTTYSREILKLENNTGKATFTGPITILDSRNVDHLEFSRTANGNYISFPAGASINFALTSTTPSLNYSVVSITATTTGTGIADNAEVKPGISNYVYLGTTSNAWKNMYTRAISLQLQSNTSNWHTVKYIRNITTKSDLGWSSTSTNGEELMTTNTLAYWDGSYQTDGTVKKSNLMYLNGLTLEGTTTATYKAVFAGTAAATIDNHKPTGGAVQIAGGISTNATSYLMGTVHVVGSETSNPITTRAISGGTSDGDRGSDLTAANAGLFLNYNGGPVQIGHSTSATINSNTNCAVIIKYNQDAASTTSGAIQIAGGMGIAKKLYVGEGVRLYNQSSNFNEKNILFVDSTTSTDTTKWSRIGTTTSGNMGIYAGGTIDIRPSSASAASTTYGMTINTAGFIPNTNNKADLGSSTQKWKNTYVYNKIIISNEDDFSAYNTQLAGSFIGTETISIVRTTTSGGFMLMGPSAATTASVQARLYLSAVGTASTSSSAGTQGIAMLTLGNNIVKGTTASPGTGKGNARGTIRLYHTDSQYCDYSTGGITWNAPSGSVTKMGVENFTIIGARSNSANESALTNLILGNSSNISTTSAHSEGRITLYSEATKAHIIKGVSITTERTHSLPNVTGLIVSTSGVPTANIGGTTQPVYVTSAGVVTAASAYSTILTSVSWTTATSTGPTVNVVAGGTTKSAAMPVANTAQSGAMTTGNQTFAGIKTFSRIRLTNETDASGSTNNETAFIIGPTTGTHITFDPNEIICKSNTSSVATLWVQENIGFNSTQIWSNGTTSNGGQIWAQISNTATGVYLEADCGVYGSGGGNIYFYASKASASRTATYGIYFHPKGNTAGAKVMDVSDDGYVTFIRAYNAVWNDYAEHRSSLIEEPGRVITEHKDGQMILANQRLMPGCKVISDTYGTSMGETNIAKTPIAVAGRVLVYPYQSRDKYELGAAVCSAPNGTVDIMTREEIREYPERIIGTVSEIPNYTTWYAGTGNKKIQVNGRIWIYVR